VGLEPEEKTEAQMDQISALAKLVDRKLTARKLCSPGVSLVRQFLQVMYTTSMKKEESEPLKCAAVYLDPSKPEKAVSPLPDSWKAFQLEDSVPFDTRHLGKISHAVDPNAVVLAVHSDEQGRLYVWGLIDQVAVHALRMATGESWRSQSMPGEFYVAVNGVADLTVWYGLEILAALKQDVLVDRFDNVLYVGPVSDRLDELASALAPRVVANLEDLPEQEAAETLSIHLKHCLARILLNVQSYRHGGALLISNDTKAHLAVKHGIMYDRLPAALVNSARQAIRESEIGHYVYDHRLPEGKSIPPETFKEYVRADMASRDSMAEMAGCVRFVASLSRVDGLILMDRQLVVHGFGVEIVDATEVNEVQIAGDEAGGQLRRVDANEFGMRHRSMFRYCKAHPDSLGFVISQDGLVRTIMAGVGKVIMWENTQALLTVDEGSKEEAPCPHCRVEVVASPAGQ
jgi:hypothetical protein